MSKIGMAAGVGAVVVGAVGGLWLSRPMSSVVGAESYEVPAATSEQLEVVGGLRIFFAHQSVGMNILDATPGVFAAAGIEAPEVVESEDPDVGSGPILMHTFVGRNRDPLGKLEEFDRIMRSGMGEDVDVAMLKLCYIDIRDGTDVEALFESYRATIAALERDFPGVTFIHSTAPLTTEFGGPFDRLKRRVKDLVGRDNLFVPAHNVAREQLNALIRAEYRDSGRLFDIAAIQSTDAEGRRRVRSHAGSTYYATEDFIASDPGHLNAEGAAIAASAWYALVAESVT